MKILHIADLHIGKRVNGFNMIEDQEYILDEILKLTESTKPGAVLMAGDIYDKSQPSTEAVELLDEFLTRLALLGQPVFIISGNHDSPERLSFGSRIMENNGLHISGVFDGFLQKTTLEDEYGKVNIYMLPFIKPAMVRPFFEEPVESYEEAIKMVISESGINTDERNILVAHQFVVSGMAQPQISDSETVSIGGLDHVDASVFDDFDYVALGHLHRSQRIGRDCIRYAGSPLKYSFSEARYRKSVTLVEMGRKGEILIDQIPLTPLRDLREIRGPIRELIRIGNEDPKGSMDYIHAIITDEEEIYDALGQLRQVYPNLMALDLENSRTQQVYDSEALVASNVAEKDPLDLFSEFYQIQNNQELTEDEIRVMKEIFQQAGGIGI
ncbi:MAG: exonuclease SbcCD subunit D [Caldicoprobacterales bacterium]|jgi:exonuclease SbcD|nr:exonuclease SbcCD subunit D [Clostridiales bacterium]